MYRKIDENARMTDIEATECYPDSYIIMRVDDMESPMGTVLYVGSTQKEMIEVLKQFEDRKFCGILERINLQRSFGRVVIKSIRDSA